MSGITYDYYRIFYYVGKYRSFTKAAQMLNNSQPNITRAMNNLEGQLGVKLFIRSKNGIKLTEDGEKLFLRIEVAYDQIQMAESEIETRKSNNTEIVSIGVSDIAMYEVLYPILADFRELYPNISLHISNESTFSAVKSLKDGLIDLAIVTTPIPDRTLFECTEVMKFKEYPVVSKRFNGRTDGIDSLKSISHHLVLLLTNGTATRQFYDDVFSEKSIELKPQMTASNINQVISMVKAGLGIGFVPESIIALDDSFIKLNIKEDIPTRTICIVANKERELSKVAKDLASYIKMIYM